MHCKLIGHCTKQRGGFKLISLEMNKNQTLYELSVVTSLLLGDLVDQLLSGVNWI